MSTKTHEDFITTAELYSIHTCEWSTFQAEFVMCVR